MGKAKGNPATDIKACVAFAEAHGWRVERVKSGHLVFLSPDGVHRISTSGTPSDYRSLRNHVAALRRAGLPIPH